jgi:hypothetical protein
MGSKKLVFQSPSLPVSVNKMYFTKFNRRQLTKEGRAWKARFVTSRGGLTPKDFMSFSFDITKQYCLTLTFYIHEKRLKSKTFGEKNDKGARYKYKKLDVSNLIKMVEDCISQITGIPDQNNYKLIVTKKGIPNDEQQKVVAEYFSMEE